MAHPPSCTCATCGAPTSLRDFGYQAPDCVWAQPVDERSSRNSRNFAELGERRFVRGLLPVPLANGVGVRDPKARPFVVGAEALWLQAVIERGWTMAEYAVAVASFA